MNDASGSGEDFLSRLHERISAEPEPEGPLGYSPVLGRRVRRGDWPDQAISTRDKILAAIDAGRFEEAAQLSDFYLEEAAIIHAIYRDWLPKLIDFLRAHGVSDDELAACNASILELLRTPDGRPFHARRLWGELRQHVVELTLACGAQDAELARTRLAVVAEAWRVLHDHDVDHVYGLVDEIVARFGEEILAELWDDVIGGLFASRYAKFDIRNMPWEESLPTNVYLAIEAMRAHLVGPGRFGNVEFEEDEDRFTVRFDPCGSGGRVMRDDEIEGSGPRMEPPYNWRVLEGEHDFAWNKRGVCLYCSHCCVVLQQKPIDAFGYPARVVEPPTYPDRTDAKCAWHIYKDPSKVPARHYEEVGRKKPAQLGGEADA